MVILSAKIEFKLPFDQFDPSQICNQNASDGKMILALIDLG